MGCWHIAEEYKEEGDKVFFLPCLCGVTMRLFAWSVPMFHKLERMGICNIFTDIYDGHIYVCGEMHHGIQGETVG